MAFFSPLPSVLRRTSLLLSALYSPGPFADGLLSLSFADSWRFSAARLPAIPLAPSQTPGASLLLLCPRQTTCAQPPPLLRCSTRPAPRTLMETHTSRRRQPSETLLRMSGGKACGKQAAQYTGKQPDEGSAVTSRDTAAAKNEVHSSVQTHRKSMRLKEMSAAKQAGEKEETERQATCCAREEDVHHETSYADATSFARRAAGASLHKQGGNASLFDGGKSGGHRRADSLCSVARAPSSH